MKRLVATVGLAAFGAAGLQAQTIPTLTANPTKPWSVSGTLRGFYDDNLNTVNSRTNRQDVFGFEVSPNISFQWGNDQTKFSAAYVYSFKYYDHTPFGQSQRYDQDHAFNVALEHAFSQRTQLVVGDSFVIGQEPDYLRAGSSLATFQRISGNNIRNYWSLAIKEQFTRLFGVEVGYNNAYYDYADEHKSVNGANDFVGPSESTLLDRIEHTIHLDTLWTLQPETVAVFGYQFRWVDYTSPHNTDHELGVVASGENAGSVFSDQRNSREHYMYLGVNQVFRPDLTASARVGARYIDFYNDPNGNGNGWGPYAQLTVDWSYAQDSRLELGVSQDISSTDVSGIGEDSTSFTTSQETTVIFGSINHRFTPRLRGSVLGQFQNGTFKGGDVNSKSERDYLVGLNLSYQLSQHWSTELGYNYDKLESDLPNRSFDRNRVYIGVTAGY